MTRMWTLQAVFWKVKGGLGSAVTRMLESRQGVAESGFRHVESGGSRVESPSSPGQTGGPVRKGDQARWKGMSESLLLAARVWAVKAPG